MNTNTEAAYIHKCLDIVEARLNWGKREDWKNYDFEKLSSAIYEATDVSLSISTLKRLFGKVSYNNLPALNTLNTLAQFAGYQDWRAFKQQEKDKEDEAAQEQVVEDIPSGNESLVNKTPHKKSFIPWLLLILPFALLGYSLLGFKNKVKPGPVDVSKFRFTCNKVMSEGVPNSVVFKYDASSAATTDSVFIVQTWDFRRRTAVPKDKTEHSAIYYYPGFFRAKLLVNSQVVRTHYLMITSDGWLALVENDPVPVYFKKEEYLKKDRVEIDEAVLAKYGLSLYPQAPKTRFFYMKDMGELKNDHFTFETTVRSEFNRGAGACQYAEILIQCKDDVIIIPLAAKACIGNINLYAAGREVKSKEADLSKFGCDLTQWTTLKVETINKHMRFFVNGEEAYSLIFPNNPTGIVGVQYRFNGMGAVKDTRFTSGGKIMYRF